MKLSKEFLARLSSRKFLLALVGLVVSLLKAFGADVPQEVVDNVIEVIMTFIIVEGSVDAVKAYINPTI